MDKLGNLEKGDIVKVHHYYWPRYYIPIEDRIGVLTLVMTRFGVVKLGNGQTCCVQLNQVEFIELIGPVTCDLARHGL